jgi:hypothetical protein
MHCIKLGDCRTAHGPRSLDRCLPGLLLVKPEEPHHLGSNLPHESAKRPAEGFLTFLLRRKCRPARLRRQIGFTLPSLLALDGGCNGSNNDSTKVTAHMQPLLVTRAGHVGVWYMACMPALHPSLMLFVPRSDHLSPFPLGYCTSPRVLYLLPFFFGATTL